jgi:hypothetical protein
VLKGIELLLFTVPRARETNYQNFGLQVDATALRFGGAGRAELWGDTRCH